MRRLFHPVAVVLFVGLVFAGCQTSATRTSAKSEKTAKTNALTPFDLESGVLTVGYAPDYPPYEYTDKTGSPAGIAVDVITEVARRMDMETRLQALSRDEALQALNEGQIDVIAWMPYSPERGREFVLSVGWAQTTSSVFVRKTSKYNEISDVVPKVMVAPTGNIEYDMRALIPQILDRPKEEVTLTLEMLVRAYDPCISCSTHYLKVEFVR